MDIQALLRGIHNCACEGDHTCDIRYVALGTNTIPKLFEICHPFAHILLVSDENTFPLCGEKTKAILGDKLESEVRFSAEIVVPNELAIAKIEAAISSETDFIIGIGSGVINDLCKYVSFLHGLRYAIVATAPSMDGYASVGAALILDEMKVTLNARVPYAIVADQNVLCTSPIDMLRSGYGDILGKYSCLNDWRLARLLRNEYFCPYVYDTVLQTVKQVEATAASLLARDPQVVCALMEALVIVGIMMSYVGNSRPASGSEHHLSHYFEITGLLNQTPYYLHGIDVLYASLVTAQIRESIIKELNRFEKINIPSSTERECEIRRIYSTAADGILALQEKVGLYSELQSLDISAHAKEICSILADSPRYLEMKGFADAIGLDVADFVAFYGEDCIRDGMLYAKDLKDRFTILWLSFALGIDRFEL